MISEIFLLGKKDNLYDNYHQNMATNLIGSCPCSPIEIRQLDSISSSHYGINKFKTETRKNGVTYKANPCNDHKSPNPDCKSTNPDCKSPNPDCKSPYPDCKSPYPDCKSQGTFVIIIRIGLITSIKSKVLFGCNNRQAQIHIK